MTAQDVRVPSSGALLSGQLYTFADAVGIVAFAHGSGSSRHSPRNRAVAEELHRSGTATLLFDLLTPQEEQADAQTGRYRFDTDLLAERLTGAVDWLAEEESTAGMLPIGLFGASTGAAAALRTAAERPDRVAGVVSRGGRPDLAGATALGRVRAPTLLIVGGADSTVLGLNESAADQLGGPHRVHVVAGASHLFEERGALEEVADTAADWFGRVFRQPHS